MKKSLLVLACLVSSQVFAIGYEPTLQSIVLGIDRVEQMEGSSGVIFPATVIDGLIFTDQISDVSVNCKNNFSVVNKSKIYCAPFGVQAKAFLVADLGALHNSEDGPVIYYDLKWVSGIASLETTKVYGKTLYKLVINK